MTAPTPERRVGAWLTMTDEQARGEDWPGAGANVALSLGYWSALSKRWEAEAVAQRAEVERLTKEKAEAMAVASDALHLAWGRLVFGHDDESEDNALQSRLAALSLPTPAPEATEEEERNFAARQPFLGCRKDAIAPEGVTDAS